ncbi:tubulin delta chain-like [Hetaerina americana]|uniref:tubulin delta chain-like n=1 Tax=Hetaerina americana TaxID=62018 RepID=UPI003A7F251C
MYNICNAQYSSIRRYSILFVCNLTVGFSQIFPMAVITLQFGQCGNQMGHELFNLISQDMQVTNHGVSRNRNSEYIRHNGAKFFRTSPSEEGNLIARCVLVDTEKKVLRDVLCNNTSLPFTYDSNNVVSGEGGSANNWAYGYYHKGPELSDLALDVIRKEIEKCDAIYTFLGLLSTAGGTGSGVGSHILECVRDEYPRKTLANVVVLPFSKGEVAVQSYNTLFTLSNLLEVSDSIIVFRNDHLHHLCCFQLNIKDASLYDLNELAMRQLSSLFLCNWDDYGFLTNLTPHPIHKFITLESAPHVPQNSVKFETPIEWKTLAKEAKRIIQNRRLSEQKESRLATLANVVITRGSGSEHSSVFDPFKKMMYFPKWVPPNLQLSMYHEDRRFLNFDKYFTWGTNSSDIYWPLKCNIEKAYKLYSYHAYVHQYKAYNVKEEDFLEVFTKAESVLKAYKSIMPT